MHRAKSEDRRVRGLSAVELPRNTLAAEDFAEGDYSAEELLQHQLDQIEELDVSTLNEKERLIMPIIPDAIDEP
ncbi:hypothetical protein [Paenibacillus sp. GCM10027626]|uniref:hypothetical protein n=1 Tax=Paenibacillus sp. GCM10027626 TaxID=3273411 RepID=UPI00364269CF